MTFPFKEIIIIYNPNSTGDSEANAKRLAEQLTNRLPRVKTRLLETTHRGHAEEIGAEYARRNAPVLLISSSGDGGYNELVNGVLLHENTNVATYVLPSGNANDHYNATAEGELIDRIVAGDTEKIDMLGVTASKAGKKWHRYAHSYIGVGLTAYIGKKLNHVDLNPSYEKWLVFRYLLKFGNVSLKLENDETWHRYSSVVVANIDRMSKHIKLSDYSSITDGEAELYVLRRPKSVWWLLRYLITGVSAGLRPARRGRSFAYMSKRAHEIQCDGEVFRIAGGHRVRIAVKKEAIRVLSSGN